MITSKKGKVSPLAQRPLEIPTLYGDGTAKVSVRRLSMGEVAKLQAMFAEAGEDFPRVCAANREMLRACVVEPSPTDEILDELEDDHVACTDLIQRIRAHNKGDHERAVGDFRARDAQPEGVPPAS
jgi:hypothetical protein